jgi:cell division transport system ATP-binding protein
MFEAVISFKNGQIYQQENLVLDNVNLSIKQTEFVYLIGKTGSGKSSFLKTLYAELPIKEGYANIAGFDLNNLSDEDIPYLRRKLGIVFQDFKLLNDRSVKQNLLFVLKATGWRDKEKINQRIDEVLSKVGMQSKRDKMPFELSGGEQQRIAIARALLNDTDLILADEPTGNLDPATSIEIMNVLKEIHLSGKAILMATHDYPLILKYPQRTLKCEDGKIFEIIHPKSNR